LSEGEYAIFDANILFHNYFVSSVLSQLGLSLGAGSGGSPKGTEGVEIGFWAV
jgi:hypothetical protein